MARNSLTLKVICDKNISRFKRGKRLIIIFFKNITRYQREAFHAIIYRKISYKYPCNHFLQKKFDHTKRRTQIRSSFISSMYNCLPITLTFYLTIPQRNFNLLELFQTPNSNFYIQYKYIVVLSCLILVIYAKIMWSMHFTSIV